MIKRLVDVVAALAGLIVLSPVLAIAALAVKADTPGPVFFRQERVGRHGIPFRIFKFRTMGHGDTATGPRVTRGGDPRITRVGAWLRRSKIDELPQLLNVVTGDMSLVGPRPEVAEYVALWGDEARAEILSVRPGITDPATVKFRNEEAVLAGYDDAERAYREVLLPEKVRLYRDYVRTQSFLGDLKIVAATLHAVVSG